VSSREIDNAQTAHAQGNSVSAIVAMIIGSSMNHDLSHSGQDFFAGPASFS